jgi:hypothetical protein
MAQFVDQPHGKQRPGVDRVGIRSARPVFARPVESLGQPAARPYIGENNVSAVSEEKIVNLGCFPNCAGDVKFHLSDASTRCYQYLLKNISGVLDASGTSNSSPVALKMICVEPCRVSRFGCSQ